MMQDWPVKWCTIGQLNDAREKYGFDVWSYDDKILYKVNNEVKVYYD